MSRRVLWPGDTLGRDTTRSHRRPPTVPLVLSCQRWLGTCAASAVGVYFADDRLFSCPLLLCLRLCRSLSSAPSVLARVGLRTLGHPERRHRCQLETAIRVSARTDADRPLRIPTCLHQMDVDGPPEGAEDLGAPVKVPRRR